MSEESTNNPSIRVIVADAQPMFRRGLQLMLRKAQGIDLVAEADSCASLLGLLDRTEADVLLLDQDLLGRGAGWTLQQFRARRPQLPCVLMGSTLDSDEVMAAMRQGIRGILLKTMPAEVIEACVRKVASGGRWIEMKSFGDAIEAVLAAQSSESSTLAALSPREQEIVRLVSRGLRNREIAERCGIREATVKSHLSHIFEKTGVESRLELARLELELRPAPKTR
ncbi:MAG: response regulator transcription factor [Pseudomonadota bacterium]|nr:response regulator transcription factor [Pseudomonadota bacterium]